MVKKRQFRLPARRDCGGLGLVCPSQGIAGASGWPLGGWFMARFDEKRPGSSSQATGSVSRESATGWVTWTRRMHLLRPKSLPRLRDGPGWPRMTRNGQKTTLWPAWRVPKVTLRTNKVTLRTNKVTLRTNKVALRTLAITSGTDKLAGRTSKLTLGTAKTSGRTLAMTLGTLAVTFGTDKAAGRTTSTAVRVGIRLAMTLREGGKGAWPIPRLIFPPPTGAWATLPGAAVRNWRNRRRRGHGACCSSGVGGAVPGLVGRRLCPCGAAARQFKACLSGCLTMPERRTPVRREEQRFGSRRIGIQRSFRALATNRIGTESTLNTGGAGTERRRTACCGLLRQRPRRTQEFSSSAP